MGGRKWKKKTTEFYTIFIVLDDKKLGWEKKEDGEITYGGLQSLGLKCVLETQIKNQRRLQAFEPDLLGQTRKSGDLFFLGEKNSLLNKLDLRYVQDTQMVIIHEPLEI